VARLRAVALPFTTFRATDYRIVFLQPTPESNETLTADGGRGRIRTSVARKERQIYSLLVLATHPPVRTGKAVLRSNARTRLSFRDTRPIELVKRGIAYPFFLEIRPNTVPKISWRRDLNPRPSDYKSDALPAELRQRYSNQGMISERSLNCNGIPNRKGMRFQQDCEYLFRRRHPDPLTACNSE
jgi:hypothetical protein